MQVDAISCLTRFFFLPRKVSVINLSKLFSWRFLDRQKNAKIRNIILGERLILVSVGSTPMIFLFLVFENYFYQETAKQ